MRIIYSGDYVQEVESYAHAERWLAQNGYEKTSRKHTYRKMVGNKLTLAFIRF